ncbi:DEAD/DEAH box helicase family protein [Streptomyces lydicus]|uniref:DEAD/DEAH box helicase family protein n=2 Tax=Streptomyces lydicus TaxID=47763 RepID=UPI0037A13047
MTDRPPPRQPHHEMRRRDEDSPCSPARGCGRGAPRPRTACKSSCARTGLRTQVIMATGSGKSLVAVRSAEELHAGRVLVLVPSLDLLVQTEAAWREGGTTTCPTGPIRPRQAGQGLLSRRC